MLIGVALLLTFLIQTFLAKVYVIPSGSMETTLHGCNGCVNDRVLVDKISYRFGDPQPGDVVVFRGPDSWRNTEFTVPRTENPLLQGLQLLGSVIGLAPPDEKDFVKRVIAVGGQTVQCCDSRNRVVVDGEPLEEPYIYYDPRIGDPRQDPFGPVRVPDGELWMMGDSRNNSADSRVPGHGPVPVENVIGKVQFIVLADRPVRRGRGDRPADRRGRPRRDHGRAAGAVGARAAGRPPARRRAGEVAGRRLRRVPARPAPRLTGPRCPHVEARAPSRCRRSGARAGRSSAGRPGTGPCSRRCTGTASVRWPGSTRPAAAPAPDRSSSPRASCGRATRSGWTG